MDNNILAHNNLTNDKNGNEYQSISVENDSEKSKTPSNVTEHMK